MREMGRTLLRGLEVESERVVRDFLGRKKVGRGSNGFYIAGFGENKIELYMLAIGFV